MDVCMRTYCVGDDLETGWCLLRRVQIRSKVQKLFRLAWDSETIRSNRLGWFWWLRLSGRNMLEWLNNNKLINPKLICAFCWFVLFFRLGWFGHVQRMGENIIPKRVLYMNLGTTRLRSRPRNRWQDGVREDERIVEAEVWQEKFITERNGRSSLERQGIVEFCTCQWNGMNEWGSV